MKYFLSIGSNIDAKKNLDFAYKELKNILDNIQSSSIYITKAEGFVAVDHTENGIKLVDRLEFSKNNFNAGKPGEKK